jgi:hypothetical protein
MLDWDRLHDYVLHRYFHDRARVSIRFRGAPVSAQELMALRRCVPRFRDMAPSSVRESIGDSAELSLGEMPGPEARRWITAIEAEGLQVVAESASFISYLPVNRTTGSAWLIENDDEAAAIAQAMLAAGVPVQDIEA